MSFLRRANPNDVIRVETPDAEGWVELKADFSKREINNIVLKSPKQQDDIGGTLDFIMSFADVAVMEWSMVDEDGKPIKWSIAEYYKLSAEAAQWLDKVLAEHLQKTIGKDVEELEKKPS